jgi:hypothetical protein
MTVDMCLVQIALCTPSFESRTRRRFISGTICFLAAETTKFGAGYHTALDRRRGGGLICVMYPWC